MTLAAAFLLMLVTTVPVKADSSVPLVADMKQTDASTTSAGISWSCPGSESSWKYVSPQPDVTKIKNNKSKKGIQISWDKIKGANRYVVYVSTKKDSGYKKFQTTTKTGTVIKKCGKNKLKSGKNYYFYVEPQKKVGNKYVSGLAGNANYCWSLKYKK